MLHKFRLFVVLSLGVFLPGCGGVKPVPGGTAGTLSAGGDVLAEIQVTIHQVEGGSPRSIGFGVTDRDGWFELVTTGARGPLWLAAGEYRCTLESAGAPIEIPKEYARAETTPLKVSLSADGSELDLEIPTALLVR
ncbi:MAG TPA: hypothetical protein VGH74_18620 [Planctomycetaceae bacterium]|jgi:hypothetical protein